MVSREPNVFYLRQVAEILQRPIGNRGKLAREGAETAKMLDRLDVGIGIIPLPWRISRIGVATYKLHRGDVREELPAQEAAKPGRAGKRGRRRSRRDRQERTGNSAHRRIRRLIVI